MEIRLKSSNNISKKYKQNPAQDELNQSLLEETLNLIQALNKMRFVQKISRPIDKRLKEEYVQKFAGKMEMLHHKLQLIQKQCSEKQTSDVGNVNNIPKTKQSLQGSLTMKTIDWKKSIRNIQNRYTEILEEGSFKHYKKLMILNNFSYKLDTIDIHGWATNCLSNYKQKTKFCCC